MTSASFMTERLAFFSVCTWQTFAVHSDNCGRFSAFKMLTRVHVLRSSSAFRGTDVLGKYALELHPGEDGRVQKTNLKSEQRVANFPPSNDGNAANISLNGDSLYF